MNKLLPTFRRQKRFYSFVCIFLLAAEIVFPTAAYALTGGPSQPEVEGFQAISVNDMVDPFTGDFSYNIPLLDIDGYPINLVYQSGVSMDAEASWVGLGWNLNAGSLTRSMRGIPDDFKGDLIKNELYMKPNNTFGVTGGIGLELFGKESKGSPPKVDTISQLNLNFSLGTRFNNYSGIGIEISISAALSAAGKIKNKLNGSLGLTSSSDNGVSLEPSIGLSSAKEEKDKYVIKKKSNVGLSFNSREGLKDVTISASYSKNIEKKDANSKSKNRDWKGGPSGTFNFGYSSHTPEVQTSMKNLSISARFTVGAELFGVHGNWYVNGYFSGQKLKTNITESPAFGYLYAEGSHGNPESVMDFNRERDGGFTPNAKALPLTNFTYDIYSASAHGSGGSFRPMRGEVSYVRDNAGRTISAGGALGLEFGVGNAAHNGVNIAVNYAASNSGMWTSDDNASSKLLMRSSNSPSGVKDYENVYFIDAGERGIESDTSFYNSFGGAEPMRFVLKKRSKFQIELSNQLTNGNGQSRYLPAQNHRKVRARRNQVFHILTRAMHEAGFGIQDPHPNSSDVQAHHVSQVMTYSTEGARYVYGIAAYNNLQQDVSFSVGDRMYSSNSGIAGNCNTGLLNYSSNPNAASEQNDLGNDNYFSRTTTPGYAHSYLLTSVLSPDYVDSDNIKGPSDGDLGYYTTFHYSKIDNYKWRVPYELNTANFNEGLKTNASDDKASYLYGEKELWYLDSIVGKTHVAIFHTQARQDGLGVTGKDGGKNTDTTKAQRLLKKISLYVVKDRNEHGAQALPVKEVHFEYDYSLCKNIPNQLVPGQGKLTLKKVWFTYQNSNKGKMSPYRFVYSSVNPDYDITGYDRWGNYKRNTNSGCHPLSSDLNNAEYPYTTMIKDTADLFSQAWSLSQIKLPSGGIIQVEYESDDYGWVQHKRAMQMFRILGTEGETNTEGVNELVSVSDDAIKNRVLYFELHPEFDGNISEYFKGIDDLYFRCLSNMHPSDNSKLDYVSGYAKPEEYGTTMLNGDLVGYVKLYPAKLRDNGSTIYNPISVAAIQFGRRHLGEYVWDRPQIDDSQGLGADILSAIILSVTNIGQVFSTPNNSLWNKGIGKKIVTHKSWIRLNNPTKRKYGGGSRVKKILMSDNWNTMTDFQETSFAYGQEYQYKNADGTSSGVAAYEPQLGGDENPWKQPDSYSEKVKLMPDDQFYSEKPYGESFFPGPSVGYARVEVKNLERLGVTRHATGKIVHEFYTAREFPVITRNTDVEPLQEKTMPWSISSLLNIRSMDYLTASQGFTIELNDMHGKPKSQHVYQEGAPDAITSVKYIYDIESHSFGNDETTTTEVYPHTFRLRSNVSAIDNKGNIGDGQLGVFMDMVADLRESKTEAYSGAINPNIDAFVLPIPVPVVIPTIHANVQQEKTQFRSATTTKVIQRSGILKETIATDLGSIVSTQNLLYDRETGEVLLTSTKTNFNDLVYSLTVPGHWYYDDMGPAYKNIGYTISSPVTFNTSGTATIANASNYFVEGDELMILGYGIGWVTTVSANSITVVRKTGAPAIGTFSGLSVLRSGRRNQASTPIASVVSLSDPRTGIKTNSFSKVLSSSAIEFGEVWRTYCDCFDGNDDQFAYSTNPYILGRKGNWKPLRSWTHLAGRTQSTYNNNTNIRRDGIFTSYTPFYKFTPNGWRMDNFNWTYVSEVTEFNPFGSEIENKDALGRYSASQLGYRQTQPIAVAANAKYAEIGFDGFEDYGFSPCADAHFKFDNPVLSTAASHSGRYSVKVSSGTDLVLTKAFEACLIQDCTTEIGTTTGEGYRIVTVSGQGSGAEFDYEVIQGDPVINIVSGQFRVYGTGWTIKVIIREPGCLTSKIISQ